jgi:Flp pilus assembly protein TadD
MIDLNTPDFKTNAKNNPQSRYTVAFFILSALIFIIYSNTFQASWHFDDYENVESNPRIQIKDLHPETLYLTFFASPEGKSKPFRSLVYFTFALNAFFGAKNVIGYHSVNIIIHLVTAFLLFLFVLKIYETPNLKKRYFNDDAFFVALLAAVLWATNPIQTQAITYIVQRMASMAAMFYILGLYSYLAARLAVTNKYRFFALSSCGCSYLFAIMSKENAALLPLSLLLVEFIFFRDCRNPRELKVMAIFLAAGILGVIAIGVVIFGNPFGFLNGYPNRTFTPLERLLTEARVVIHYLTQIFYPVPTRLSLYHDFTVSKSLFQPWSTLPSILIILSLCGLGLIWMANRPLLSFAILFFFVNHLIESTVIGLELVFEHRNYLPSLFIFLPVAAGVDRLVRYYGKTNLHMHRIMVSGIILLVVGFGTGTYIRNQAWANEKTLWEDTLAKAPNSIRAHHELAYQYYEKTGNYEAALLLYHRGLDLNGQNIYEKTLSLNNIASIYFTRGDYARAEKYWQQAIASYPKYKQGYYRLALAQTRLGKWDEAEETLALIMDQGYINAHILQLNGIIYLMKNKPETAIGYFRKCIKINPRDWQSLMYLGVSFTMAGENEKAYRFYRMAESHRLKEPLIQLLLAKNRLALGDEPGLQHYMKKFVGQVGPRHVEKYLKKVIEKYEFIKISITDLQPVLAKKIEVMADDLRQVTRQLQGSKVNSTEPTGYKRTLISGARDGA